MITELREEQFVKEMIKKINDRLEFGPVFIPGGNSFKEVYRYLEVTSNHNYPLIFTDDRLVDPTDEASNFGNLVRVNERLLTNLLDSYYESLKKYTQEQVDSNIIEVLKSSKNYSIFLGVGLDGHIASIFDPAIVETLFIGKTISILRKYGDSYNRITLNKEVIMEARNICVVINGKGKEYLVSLINSKSRVPSPLNEIIHLPKTEIFYVN